METETSKTITSDKGRPGLFFRFLRKHSEDFRQEFAQRSPEKQVKLVGDSQHPALRHTVDPAFSQLPSFSGPGLIFKLVVGQQNVCSTKNRSTQIIGYLIVRVAEIPAWGIKRSRKGFGFLPICFLNSQIKNLPNHINASIIPVGVFLNMNVALQGCCFFITALKD